MKKRKLKPDNLSSEEREKALKGCAGCGHKRETALVIGGGGSKEEPQLMLKCVARLGGCVWHEPIPTSIGPDNCPDRAKRIASVKSRETHIHEEHPNN